MLLWGQCQTQACCLEPSVGDGQTQLPSKAPRSISLSSPRAAAEAPPPPLATELLRCRHRYGVSPGEGVSLPCLER